MPDSVTLTEFARDERFPLYQPSLEHDSCGVGFVANIKGQASHQIVADACHILARMEHRGACGCEPETGDGAGILTGLPLEMLDRLARDQGIPTDSRFLGVGNVFLPVEPAEREKCKNLLAQNVNRFGQRLLGWRELPVDPDGAGIGVTARRAMPVIAQVMIGSNEDLSQDDFERQLFLIRKATTYAVRLSRQINSRLFYICSLSSRIIVYKGMLSTAQLPLFYPDLVAEDYASHLAMVHSRFSTKHAPYLVSCSTIALVCAQR